MDKEFALRLTEIRLRQTWHMLDLVLDEDSDLADREAIVAALEAIGRAHDIVKQLDDSPSGTRPTVAPSAA